MMLVNNFRKGYVNGSMGIIVGFDRDPTSKIDDETEFPVVELYDGKEVIASPHEWKLEKRNDSGVKEVIAKAVQVPLKLSYAITIHKSQGCSFDYVNCALHDVITPNMGYTALSRARSLEGIYLPTKPSYVSLYCDDEIRLVDVEFKKESESNENLPIVERVRSQPHMNKKTKALSDSLDQWF